MREGKRLLLTCVSLVFLFGFALTLYPIVSGAVLEYRQQQKIRHFLQLSETTVPVEKEGLLPPETAAETSTGLEFLRSAAETYNNVLASGGQLLDSPEAYETPALDLAAYGLSDGVFAVLAIPRLELTMPVYLGASEGNLALGAAHMGQTSLPLGGPDTNCVIAGHRSWKGAAYFRDLPTLEPGDEITITNPWETLRYTVTELKIIYPSDSDAVHIQPEKDLLTLLTCYYSSNGLKYRYIVISERSV